MTPANTENAEYDRSYYLLDCEGHREFEASRGRKLSRRLRKCLDLTEIRGGETFLDLGCGRGEVALHAAARGARTIALDPSLDALSILREVASADLWLRGKTPHAVRALSVGTRSRNRHRQSMWCRWLHAVGQSAR